jgi:protein required for attachment to host cells
MKRLTRHARVLVTDGGRATVLRNEGDVGHPDLRVVRSYDNDTPPSRELGTDKPFRGNNPSGDRSSIEGTDYHQQAEDRFIARIAGDMQADLKSGAFEEIIVVAPPVALGVYRKLAPPDLARATVMEINKDLTKHSHADVASIVVKALEGN